MIKINLLSDRDAIRKETTRQQLSIFLLSVLLALVVAGAVQFTLYQKKKGIQEDIRAAEISVNELKEKVGEVEKYKQFKEELRTKLDVIRNLQRNKVLSVQLLDALSQKIPERMWLGKLIKKGNDLTLEGYSIDNETIAGFMKGIEDSDCISHVELRLAENKEVQGVSLKHFLITTTVGVESKKDPANGKGKALGNGEGTPAEQPPPQDTRKESP